MRLIALLLVAVFTVSILSACGGAGSTAPTQDIKAMDAEVEKNTPPGRPGGPESEQ